MMGEWELVLCTGNPGKIAELRTMLPDVWMLRSLSEEGVDSDLPETGDRLEDNALEKARHAYSLCGKWCLADDTGLEVAALNGAPGVYSARYAGPECDAGANMQRLLREMEGKLDRKARFRTVLALVGPGEERLFEGVVHGHIADKPRGEHGFGYDPLFIPEGATLTFAEMHPGEKNVIGHRGRALAELLKALDQR